MLKVLTARSVTLMTLSACALVLALGTGRAQATPAVGKPAPDFTATDTNGITHKLSDQRGSIVVLEWTNHDCPFVRKHYDTSNMQALQKDAKAQGVVWWSVISSASGKEGYVTPVQANELTSGRKAAPSAVLLDPQGTVGRLYGARTTPHMYIIDAKGNLAYMGGIDDKPSASPADVKTANNYVRNALTALKNGQPVEPATTRPYGCSVKY
jgi:peroxiredoxin